MASTFPYMTADTLDPVNPAWPVSPKPKKKRTPLDPGEDELYSPEELNARQLRRANQYLYGQEVGSDAAMKRAARRLKALGIDPAILAKSGDLFGEGAAEDWIQWYSGRGAVEGKQARAMELRLSKTRGLKNVDELGTKAIEATQNDIGAAYSDLRERLSAMMPAGAEQDSGALLAVADQHARAREKDLASAIGSIEQQRLAQRTAIEGATMNEIGSVLEDIGYTVTLLEQMKKEERRMADLERGAFYGGLLSPTGWVGGLTSLAGGRQAGLGGQAAGRQAMTDWIALLEALKGSGAVGGPGGGTGAPAGAGAETAALFDTPIFVP